jgi:hypothetical protein
MATDMQNIEKKPLRRNMALVTELLTQTATSPAL